LTYLATVLADNPVHYWRLADQGGLLLHDIGSAPFNLAVDPIASSGPYSGISNSGASWYCDNIGPGTRQILTQAKPLSVECWVWLLDNIAFQQNIVFWDGTAATTVFCYIDAAGHANIGGTGLATATSVAQVSAQAWHHFVITSTGATTILYVDGASFLTPAGTLGTPINRAIMFGGQPTVSTHTALFVCEAAIYSTALTAARVAAHFAAQELNIVPVFLGFGNSSNAFYGAGGGAPNSSINQVLVNMNTTYQNAP
jgi:Concanavalin A-like lectin/glucanases superfamily